MMKIGDKVTIKGGLTTSLLQWWAVLHLTNETGIVVALDRTDFVDVQWPSGVVLTLPVQILNNQTAVQTVNVTVDDAYDRAMRIV